jgi:lipoprotein NlpD
VKLPGIFLAVLACASLAGCAGPYRAPVVERTVARSPAVKPPAPPVEQRPESYTVKRGDTLYSIALDKGLDYRELAAWNNITDPADIKAGLVLRMRSPGPAVAGQPQTGTQVQGVQVQPAMVPGTVESRSLGGDPRAAGQPRAGAEPPQVAGDLKTGPKAMKLPYSEQNLAMLLRQSPATTAPESPPPQPSAEDGQDTVAWMWPATGRVLAGFSEATNKGVDILGKVGDPVFASASGRVVYSGVGLRGYGKLIIIKHNQTYLSAYAHNNNLLVKEGQNVARGQKIAEIGSSDSSQAKLHFEIRRLGKPVDPLKFLPDRPS